MSVNKVKSHWNERWVKVKAKAPTKKCNYYFSDYGRLKSVDKMSGNEKLLKGSLMKQGFMQLNLKLEDGGQYTVQVRAVDWREHLSDIISGDITTDSSSPQLTGMLHVKFFF